MGKEFKPNVGRQVDAGEAQKWIDEYDRVMRKDKLVDTKAIFYGRDALLKMLAEEGTTGITFYLALKPTEADPNKKTVQLVLYPTYEDGAIKATSKSTSTDAAALKVMDAVNPYDKGLQCPPYCP
jgi:FAD/FMN-containing dehydrogenase